MAIETICFQWSSNKSQEKIIRVSNPNSLNIPLHEFAEFVNTTKCWMLERIYIAPTQYLPAWL